ncbi:hypothetical protein AYI68_g6892 [Smittium mucronatum]|uniref:Uncharacterized protein n=1 Tax=Smittium mucronatum TaxID=133383 RepID=A0A1R0GQB9_9FUNG|nr:hypothetical protein AYI68_g6892 [Smittium mucronatum]
MSLVAYSDSDSESDSNLDYPKINHGETNSAFSDSTRSKVIKIKVDLPLSTPLPSDSRSKENSKILKAREDNNSSDKISNALNSILPEPKNSKKSIEIKPANFVPFSVNKNKRSRVEEPVTSFNEDSSSRALNLPLEEVGDIFPINISDINNLVHDPESETSGDFNYNHEPNEDSYYYYEEYQQDQDPTQNEENVLSDSEPNLDPDFIKNLGKSERRNLENIKIKDISQFSQNKEYNPLSGDKKAHISNIPVIPAFSGTVILFNPLSPFLIPFALL